MTINSQPAPYSSLNAPLVWAVYDALAIDTTKENFKYIAEVKVSNTVVFTSKLYPNPTNGRGVFDLGAVLREYASANFGENQGDGSFSLGVIVNFSYEYWVGTTITTGGATDWTGTFYNYYPGRTPYQSDISNYTNQPATNRPATIYLPSGCANYYLPYMAGQTMQRINIASGATSDYTYISGSTTYNVNVICAGLYKNYIVHFLNKWGGWESMLFNKVSKKKYATEKKSFQQLPYRVSDSGTVSYSTGNTMHRQKAVFGVQFTERLRISTDWLTDAEYQWLAQLVTSPMIYLEDAGTLYPVLIENSDYEFKENIVDGLANLTLDIDFGAKYQTQFS